jgi:hypothetical protein
MVLRNLRYLVGYRRPGMVPEPLLGDVLAVVQPEDTISSVAGRVPASAAPGGIRAALSPRLRRTQRGESGDHDDLLAG